MAEMTFNQVFQAAQQLPQDQQDELIRLLQASKRSALSADEKRMMLESIIVDLDVRPADWSLERKDWYDDETL